MKTLIALVGEKGGGKETLGNLIIEMAQKEVKTVSRFRFSDILNATLEMWGIDRTRPNLQKLAKVMDASYGEGTLTRAVKRRFENDSADIAIADGVRWESDRVMIRGIAGSVMVYVTADAGLRYNRCVARARVDENKKTFEEFMN